MNGPTIQTYTSRHALAQEVAGLLADRLRERLKQKGRARLAVPGGTTPGPMLRALGPCDLDWAKVVVTLTDERWVPATSERSNERLLREVFLDGSAAAATFVPLYTGDPEPAQGIGNICDRLRRLALPLDFAVLGMGADMHTASLFPGAAGLELALSAEAPEAVPIHAPGADEPRITLSARVLAQPERHILITGADKSAALARARDLSDPLQAPVHAVLDGAIIHYAD